MQVDIYIRERDGGKEIRIPWLPEEISTKRGDTTFVKYDVMNRGEVAVPTGTGLSEYKWSSTFPGEGRTQSSGIRGQWNPPSYYDNILEDWRMNQTPLTLMVTGYPINADVYLASYEGKAIGGVGDWDYDIGFVEQRRITIAATKTSSSAARRTAKETTTYTVKPGDTLWGIAQKLLGAGSKWETIYNANKSIIESTAKKRWKAAGINRDSEHGHWIFAGTRLEISK